MRRTLYYLGIRTLASLIIFSLPVAAQKPNLLQSGLDAERLAKISLQMKSFVTQGTIAGAVTLIALRGKVVSLEAVGYQDLESRKPMRTDTIFDIRSVTKPITAIAIMILLEEGKLVLNDPVEKYLPEFKSYSQNGASVSSDHDSSLAHTHRRAATLSATGEPGDSNQTESDLS